MNINSFRSIIAVISLVFMSGCVGYASPYPHYGYGAPYSVPHPAAVPYGGYNYRPYPVAPQPYMEHGREHEHERGEGSYGHYRWHDRD